MKIIEQISGKPFEREVEPDKDCFCPRCGKKEVYTETGEGDYYEGPTSYCKNCKCSFTMPYCESNRNIEFLEP